MTASIIRQNIQEHRGRIGRVDHGSLGGRLRPVHGHSER